MLARRTAGAVREHAQARPPRALVRGAARPDIEGFVRFVREQDSVGATELEAVAEEEDTDVIRLLTIHAAKGLEFKVVVVADAGRDSRASRDEVLCLPDGRLGFKVAHPSTGKRLPTTGYDEVKEVEAEAERDERRRLYYVAMTRAIDRLIVSGSIDPSRASDAETPIGWVLERLGPAELERAGDAPLEIVRDDARLVLRVDRFRPSAPAPAERRKTRKRRRAVAVRGRRGRPLRIQVPPLPELEPVPAAPEYRIRRLSYSALALFERCSYRFYAERIAGMRPARRTGKGSRAGRHRGRRCRPRAARSGSTSRRPAYRTTSSRSCGPAIPLPRMRSWSGSAS